MYKKRILNLIKWYTIALAVLLLYALFVHVTKLAIPCIFRLITGLNCPGCGISRFFLYSMHFRFKEALSYNYAAPAILIYVIYILGSVSINYVKTGHWSLNPKPQWLNWAVLVLLVIWGIIRNILKV